MARAALGDGTPESSLARINANEDVCGLVTQELPHAGRVSGPALPDTCPSAHGRLARRRGLFVAKGRAGRGAGS